MWATLKPALERALDSGMRLDWHGRRRGGAHAAVMDSVSPVPRMITSKAPSSMAIRPAYDIPESTVAVRAL